MLIWYDIRNYLAQTVCIQRLAEVQNVESCALAAMVITNEILFSRLMVEIESGKSSEFTASPTPFSEAAATPAPPVPDALPVLHNATPLQMTNPQMPNKFQSSMQTNLHMVQTAV